MKKTLLRIIPYIISVLITAICTIIFKENLQIGLASLEPLFVILVLIVQAILMHSKDYQESGNAGDLLSMDEKRNYFKTTGVATIYLIPLIFPTLLFFDIWTKIGVSLSVTLLTYVVGAVAFRVIYRKQIKKRIEQEENDLNEQIAKETQGIKWEKRTKRCVFCFKKFI